MRILRDPAAADDVVQETLLRAWANRDSFDPEADIRPWLFRVARNLCIDAIRARTRLIASGDLPDHPSDDDPAAPVERAEEHRMLRDVLATMSDRHRQILVLRDVHGVDYQELASHLGVSEGTARVTLFRARRGLRERFVAANRALAALIFLPAIRAYHGARRTGDALGAQPAGTLIVHTGVAALTAMLLAIVPPPASVASPAVRAEAAAAASTVRGVSVEESAPSVGGSSAGAERGSTGSGPTTRKHPTISASIDRGSGSARVRSSVPNPVTGDEEYLWAEVWREAGDRDSVVLGAADDASEAACGAAKSTCAGVDGVLRDALKE